MNDDAFPEYVASRLAALPARPDPDSLRALADQARAACLDATSGA